MEAPRQCWPEPMKVLDAQFRKGLRDWFLNPGHVELSIEEIGEQLGRERQAISRYIRLLGLKREQLPRSRTYRTVEVE